MTANMGNTVRSSGRDRRLEVWGVAAALMVVPVLAIRGFDPGAWDPPGDFVLLGILLAGVGIAYEVARRVPLRRAYAAGIGLAFWAAFLNIWINLAVGIIGSEDNPANLLYAGIVGAALVGAVLARFRSAGMAGAMAATACAQVLVFFIALVAGLGFTGPVTVFFTSLWLISAWLFRRAAQGERAAA